MNRNQLIVIVFKNIFKGVIRTSKRQPHIIVILADDIGWNEVNLLYIIYIDILYYIYIIYIDIIYIYIPIEYRI